MTDDTPAGGSPSRRTLLLAGLGAAALPFASPAVHAAVREVKISMQRSSVLFTILKVKGTLAERLA
ncbi:ABC transporter substrate-binding protein, partial [Methylobacterium sp. J-048]|nr:ABC transporter substrate-binding protein [Methylobacterium sp. J-048]